MVQFYPITRDSSRDYWKLHPGERYTANILRKLLRKNNFATLKSTSIARLRTLYIRSQRGLLSYEGLPLHELKRYAAQRALPALIGQKNTIKVLKAQLEMADEEATFDRFLDLPPEIRQIIYHLHFKFLDTWTPAPKYQPPITLASRGIRHESLPHFYESCEFSIRTSGSWHAQKSFSIALYAAARAVVKTTSAQNFARIRKMYIRFDDLRIVLHMNLTKKATPIRISWCHRLPQESAQTRQKRKDRLSAELHKIGLRIATRQGPLKLCKSDLRLLHETSWSILREVSE